MYLNLLVRCRIGDSLPYLFKRSENVPDKGRLPTSRRNPSANAIGVWQFTDHNRENTET